ncbi:hypothetical protein ACWCQN_46160 [Streptomyces sp. NPDC001984]
MPARSSSPIPSGLGQLTDARLAAAKEHPYLLDSLAAVPDPRRAKGRRHSLAHQLRALDERIKGNDREIRETFRADDRAEITRRFRGGIDDHRTV